jgi:hypothetical protein
MSADKGTEPQYYKAQLFLKVKVIGQISNELNTNVCMSPTEHVSTTAK